MKMKKKLFALRGIFLLIAAALICSIRENPRLADG